MAQGYYTLDEAAKMLQMPAEELSQMAQRREVRAFADRGTWRFKSQDIEELARRRGLGSSPDLPLHESNMATPATPPKFSELPTGPLPAKSDVLSKSPTAPLPHQSGKQEVFGFDLGEGAHDQVEIGKSGPGESPSSASRKSDPAAGGPRTPKPIPGSDSDVRLVAEGSDIGLKASPGGPGSSARRKGSPEVKADSDSDVKIVPDSAENVDIGTPPVKQPSTDSDIRLEESPQRKPVSSRPDDSFFTEEIDLDQELIRAEDSAIRKSKEKIKLVQPKSATAPFELSEPELDLGSGSGLKSSAKPPSDASMSDFDLALDQDDLSLELSSSEFDLRDQAKKTDDSSAIGSPGKKDGSGDSGIKLNDPADAGISLEPKKDSDDSIDFEISLDGAGNTPKPSQAKVEYDSSSEFELTLEDSGKLKALEDETPTAEDRDVASTDFEVPALDEDSDSQVAALDDSDTDLESSDFDLAISEDDMVTEEESGSQVVAIEDESDVDDADATVAKPRDNKRIKKGPLADDEGDSEGSVSLLDEDEDTSRSRPRPGYVAAPADWGTLVPACLLVGFFVLLLGGLASFELVRGLVGYRQPNAASSFLIRSLLPLVGQDAKDVPE